MFTFRSAEGGCKNLKDLANLGRAYSLGPRGHEARDGLDRGQETFELETGARVLNDGNDPKASNAQLAKLGLFRRVERHIQSRTLSGLLQLLPLLATAWVLSFLVRQTDSLIRDLTIVDGRPWDFPGIGLLAVIVLCYIVGMLIENVAGRKIMDGVSKVVSFIPVIKTIYGVTQQATTSMTSQFNFTRVVFLEWPREGMVAMGFVTGRAYTEDGSQSMVSVYIPTVPNPTSGNMAFVIEDEVMETDISVDDAMKLIFSGGIVLPKEISLARLPRHEGGIDELIGRFETE